LRAASKMKGLPFMTDCRRRFARKVPIEARHGWRLTAGMEGGHPRLVLAFFITFVSRRPCISRGEMAFKTLVVPFEFELHEQLFRF
jgi:hypothetical protein